MYLSPERMFLLFFVYSAIGWIIELIYRWRDRGTPVNPGFLRGPWLPLYGTGAVLIIALYSAMGHLHPALRGLAYLTVLTLVEYAAGLLLLRVFDRRCWDYSDEPLNFQGLICPGFSLYWVILAFVFEKTLYPLSLWFVRALEPSVLAGIDALALSLMTVDFVIASGLAERVRALSENLRPRGLRLPADRLLPALVSQYGHMNRQIGARLSRFAPEYTSARDTVRDRALALRRAIAVKFGLDATLLQLSVSRLRGCPRVRKLIDRIRVMK